MSGQKTGPDALHKAIADLEELKRRRAEGEPQTPGKLQTPGETQAPRRGRPPKAAAEAAAAVPAKRGRKPRADRVSADKAGADPATGGPPTFGVGQPTVHRPLGLLEVQHKADLDALLADPRLAPHITLRLDDRFALVLPAQQDKLLSALLKVGHTPKLQPAGTSASGTSASGTSASGTSASGPARGA